MAISTLEFQFTHWISWPSGTNKDHLHMKDFLLKMRNSIDPGKKKWIFCCQYWCQNRVFVWPHHYSWTQIDVSIIFRIKFWSFSSVWFFCRPKNYHVNAFWKIMMFHESERRRLQQGAKPLIKAFSSRRRSDSWNVAQLRTFNIALRQYCWLKQGQYL